jgi:hypothetical protein
MPAPIPDDQLKRWAREHLVYEGRMLSFTAVRLLEREGISRDPESNALLEAFAVHVRCLRDFLWGQRRNQPMDAFADDFCDGGVWERKRGPEPAALDEIGDRNRAGREVVHLTYHRLSIDAEKKDWDCGEIYVEIVDALAVLAEFAVPTRMDDETRIALQDLQTHSPGVGTLSVATGAIYGQAITGGTVGFPGFHAGS